MIVKLLTEHHVEFLSLDRGCSGSSDSTHVKMPHSWKSHVTAQLFLVFSSQSLEMQDKSDADQLFLTEAVAMDLDKLWYQKTC